MKNKTIKISSVVSPGDKVFVVQYEREQYGKDVKCRKCPEGPTVKLGKTTYKCASCDGTGTKTQARYETVVRLYEDKVSCMDVSVYGRGHKAKGKRIPRVYLQKDSVNFTLSRCKDGSLGGPWSMSVFTDKAKAKKLAEAKLVPGRKIIRKTQGNCVC